MFWSDEFFSLVQHITSPMMDQIAPRTIKKKRKTKNKDKAKPTPKPQAIGSTDDAEEDEVTEDTRELTAESEETDEVFLQTSFVSKAPMLMAKYW